MDFLIGILLVMITIILLYNFATISISNTQYGGNCNSGMLNNVNNIKVLSTIIN